MAHVRTLVGRQSARALLCVDLESEAGLPDVVDNECLLSVLGQELSIQNLMIVQLSGIQMKPR